MANISLQVAQDPNTAASLSLADTLAKATFGDPEAQMKAKALGAEVGVRMASGTSSWPTPASSAPRPKPNRTRGPRS